jgi:hypothetical protein
MKEVVMIVDFGIGPHVIAPQQEQDMSKDHVMHLAALAILCKVDNAEIQMSVPVIMVAVLKIAIILMEATTAPVMEDTP